MAFSFEMERNILKNSRKRAKRNKNKSSKKSRTLNYSQESIYMEKHNKNNTEIISKLVEYSDVSSEDFSAPEAGEIQTEDSDADFFGIKRNDNKFSDSGNYQSGSFSSKVSNRINFQHNANMTTLSPDKKNVFSNVSLEEFPNSDDESKKIKKKKDKHKHKKNKKNKKKKKKRAKSQESTIESISDNDSIFDEGTNLTPPIKSHNLTGLIKEASPISPGKLLHTYIYLDLLYLQYDILNYHILYLMLKLYSGKLSLYCLFLYSQV